MTPWELISTGYPVQTGDPVGSDRITTSPARAGTGEPLHRLEPVPVRPESDRYHALVVYGDKVEILVAYFLVVYFRVDFVRELPGGPQRCVTFVWATTQGDFVAYCNLRQSWSDDKS